jgi:hypothetical protein
MPSTVGPISGLFPLMGPLRPGMFSEERPPSSTSRPKAYPTLDYPRVIKTTDERTLEFYSREALKAGEGEGRDRFGRYYHYVTPLQLKDIFEKGAPWAALQIHEVPGAGYDGVPVTWLNCIAAKL